MRRSPYSTTPPTRQTRRAPMRRPAPPSSLRPRPATTRSATVRPPHARSTTTPFAQTRCRSFVWRSMDRSTPTLTGRTTRRLRRLPLPTTSHRLPRPLATAPTAPSPPRCRLLPTRTPRTSPTIRRRCCPLSRRRPRPRCTATRAASATSTHAASSPSTASPSWTPSLRPAGRGREASPSPRWAAVSTACASTRRLLAAPSARCTYRSTPSPTRASSTAPLPLCRMLTSPLASR